MTAGIAGPGDLPRLKEIWRRCFGDPDWYMDYYFTHGFPLFETMVMRENGKIGSMLTLIPAEYALEHERLSARYIYAVATDPAMQGRGLASALLNAAHEQMRGQGIKVVALFPASDSLYDYYGRLGYRTAFGVREMKVTPGINSGQTVRPCGKEEFLSLREAFLAGMPRALHFTPLATAYLYEEAEFSGGKIVLLQGRSLQGYAVCTKIETTLVVKETNLTEAELNRCSGALAVNFGVANIRAKFPAASGETVVRHGMACVLNEVCRKAVLGRSDGYMNLVLD